MGNRNFISYLGKFILYIILCLIAIITLFPVLYAIFGSFKENMELMTSVKLIPVKWTMSNYITIWREENFSRYTFNSVIISLSVMIGAILTSTMSGYVLSRKMFPGKKVLKTMYISSMFIALGPVTLYPMFKLVVDLKLNNSYIGLILVLIGGQIINMILVEGYLRGIPRELDESAIIDGCGFFRVYWNILFPLMKPIIAIVGLLTFQGSWNNYLLPLILTMGRKSITPLTVAVVQMKSSGMMASSWSLMLAGCSISIVPIIILYTMANKYFIAGLTSGALKG